MKSIGRIQSFTRNRISSNIKYLWNQIYLKWTELSRTVLKYAILENIRPIWVQIFSIEFEWFFVKFLSISYRCRIVSIRTTSLSVELNDYLSYLLKITTMAATLIWPHVKQGYSRFELMLYSLHLIFFETYE